MINCEFISFYWLMDVTLYAVVRSPFAPIYQLVSVLFLPEGLMIIKPTAVDRNAKLM